MSIAKKLAAKTAKEFYIVWNESRTEGFITDDEDDATYASTGFRCRPSVSTVGEAFREAYADEDADEDDGIELPTQTVRIDTAASA